MRKLKYHVAITLDGFISHTDHTVNGFVEEGKHVTDYFAALKDDYEVVLMGRITYEFGFQFGVTNPYPWLRQYVISQSMEKSPDANVELVSVNVVDFVRELKEEIGKDIYLCGGADLAARLLDESLIDEIIVKLNPVVFGTGIPLFSGTTKQKDLELYSSKVYGNSVMLLNYRVKERSHPESVDAT
jgi:dihydrofolate reductase